MEVQLGSCPAWGFFRVKEHGSKHLIFFGGGCLNIEWPNPPWILMIFPSTLLYMHICACLGFVWGVSKAKNCENTWYLNLHWWVHPPCRSTIKGSLFCISGAFVFSAKTAGGHCWTSFLKILVKWWAWKHLGTNWGFEHYWLVFWNTFYFSI